MLEPLTTTTQPINQQETVGLQPTNTSHNVPQVDVPESSRRVPRWLTETLKDSPLDMPLSSRTRLGARRAQGLCTEYDLESTCHEEEPVSFEEAEEDPHWMAAMQPEFDAIMKNDTWFLTDLPVGKKAIGVKWVYKIKRHADGSVERYKARLVAKGYAQQKGI